ncbi:MAG: hypothetical protein GY778_23420 [bacterium]|nr:hypothetical protein [bacterium]
MVTIQSHGNDPGMEIINSIWPDEAPFRTNRHELLSAAAGLLDRAEARDLCLDPLADEDSLFRYHLHVLPNEVGNAIGTSTLLAAWNAAIYVAQIEDDRLQEALTGNRYIEATRDALREHGGLWFQDESFVIRRKA